MSVQLYELPCYSIPLFSRCWFPWSQMVQQNDAPVKYRAIQKEIRTGKIIEGYVVIFLEFYLNKFLVPEVLSGICVLLLVDLVSLRLLSHSFYRISCSCHILFTSWFSPPCTPNPVSCLRIKARLHRSRSSGGTELVYERKRKAKPLLFRVFRTTSTRIPYLSSSQLLRSQGQSDGKEQE